MTNEDKYPMYALAIVAGAAIAVWAGLPLAFLFLLLCPVMMFFMMRGMGGMSGGQRGDDNSRGKDAAAKRSDASPLMAHTERIDEPRSPPPARIAVALLQTSGDNPPPLT